jgi:integrase/recombinase XerD
MLETYLNSPVTRRRLRAGPAADRIDDFADWLHRHGYRPITIDTLLRSLAGWTDWMLAAGFTAQDLLPGFEACKMALKEEQHVRYRRGANHQSVTAASVFIRFLQQQGELPYPVSRPSASELWPMLGEFCSWMRKHRGLTETTLDVYQRILVGLLNALGDDARAYCAEGRYAPSSLSGRALTGFIVPRASLWQSALSSVSSVSPGDAHRAWSMPSPVSHPGSSRQSPGFSSWRMSSG